MIISKKQTVLSLKLIRVLLVVITNITLSSCSDENQATSHEYYSQVATHRVEVALVENKSVYLTQKVSGTLEATTKIRLYNDESARIMKLPFHEGDLVNKGSILIQLDNEILKSDVAKATAEKQQAKVDLERVKKLLTKKLSTEEQVTQAKTSLDLATAEENHQLTRLKRTTITAPIDGLITQRRYEPGDLLAPQTHIQTIIDTSSLRLKVSLAERWIPVVDMDQDVLLRLSAFGNKSFIGKIKRIHPTINTNTHKGTIEILLDPVPKTAKVGQFAYAEIKLKATERLIIPVHTIHFEPQGAYTYRIIESNNEMIAEKVFITQGQQFGDVTEVLTNLKVGDKIVSRGYIGLRDGIAVEITQTNLSNTIETTNTSNKVK